MQGISLSFSNDGQSSASTEATSALKSSVLLAGSTCPMVEWALRAKGELYMPGADSIPCFLVTRLIAETFGDETTLPPGNLMSCQQGGRNRSRKG